VGITSRELRVWPQRKLLMVMNFRCSAQLHACPPGTDADFPFDIKFYDLSDPIHPRLLSSYVPTSQAGKPVKPHEMFSGSIRAIRAGHCCGCRPPPPPPIRRRPT
jgi:hypothetical protein